MSSTPDDLPDRPEAFVPKNRDEILELLESGVEEAARKVENGRVRDPENEKVRQGWIKTLCRAAREYRLLLNDLEEANHEERLAELEKELGIREE